MTTLSTLKELIAERFGKNIEDIGPETTLSSLELDSLEKIELVFDLEDHFKVRITNPKANPETLQEVADLIDSAR